MPKRFMGESVRKSVIDIGTAGQIERDEDVFPIPPPNALVTFQATAKFTTVKHKFLDKGGVEESVILVIKADTFEVLGVEEAPVQEELPTEAGAETPEPVGAGVE
jgi:hypothetical protein